MRANRVVQRNQATTKNLTPPPPAATNYTHLGLLLLHGGDVGPRNVTHVHKTEDDVGDTVLGAGHNLLHQLLGLAVAAAEVGANHKAWQNGDELPSALRLWSQ